MGEQDQCNHENMSKRNQLKFKLRQRQSFFSNHFIEVIDDTKCPLIEG